MKKIDFHPLPVLETERLTLRKMEPADENEIYALRSDDRVQKYIDRPKAKAVENARKFIEKIAKGIPENRWLYWGIAIKGQPKLIGTFCLWNFVEQANSAEIGYELHPDHQGKGYAKEAVLRVLDYAFKTLDLGSVTAVVHPENERSLQILNKNSFKYSKKQGEFLVYQLMRNK
jgi:ribosomal-protein-alanine N-acetyltransferase